MDLEQIVHDSRLLIPYRPRRYEPGWILNVEITGVAPAVKGQAELELERFAGGGFAGQVYRGRLLRLDLPDGVTIPGLTPGNVYAVKILIPPSNFSRRFRDAVYWVGFQGPFSLQVHEAACRSGLIWQRLIRLAARRALGAADAVNEAYASFHDPIMQAYGEITEWVDGRTWLLEADTALGRRRAWRTMDLRDTQSPEYVAKRRFMAAFVQLLHDMGGAELARQYEWWTLKSQPNVLKRRAAAAGTADAGLCAIDFRPGLALLPFLPMSPADVKLILAGLFRRGALVQFDRCDLQKLRRFVAAHPELGPDAAPLLDELEVLDRGYRRAVPDLVRQGWRLPFDRDLRRDVRQGLAAGYRAADLADAEFATRLADGGARFGAFYALGAVPLLGPFLRRLWGNSAFRGHAWATITDGDYRRSGMRAWAARTLIEWHRAGRTGAERCRYLAGNPTAFLLEFILVFCGPVMALMAAVLFGIGLGSWAGLWQVEILPARVLVMLCGVMAVTGLPALLPAAHRVLGEPAYAWRQARDFVQFLYRFWTSAAFREQHFLDMLAAGEKDGMLTARERESIASRVRDPFIAKYLRCLAVHFATLPVSEITYVTAGAVCAAWALVRGHPWEKAVLAFAATAGLLQLLPISPGSLCRGVYVLYLMIRERNLRDYLIAAPISFLRVIGYLAFPLQMTTTYPELARFLAGRWATSAVHAIPVFGEKGGWLEHGVFDLTFNVPQVVARWCRPRVGGILTAWLVLGLALAGFAFWRWHFPLHSKAGFNVLLTTVSVFVLPRVLFLPLLSRKTTPAGKV